jgi:hypothetical protein
LKEAGRPIGTGPNCLSANADEKTQR